MAEGFDDFEMEGSGRYKGDTYRDIYDHDDLDRLINELNTAYNDGVGTYDTDRSKNGLRKSKHRVAYEKIGERIKYAEWLKGEIKGTKRSRNELYG